MKSTGDRLAQAGCMFVTCVLLFGGFGWFAGGGIKWAAPLAAVGVVVGLYTAAKEFFSAPAEKVIRGSPLVEQKTASKEAALQRPKGDAGIPWAGTTLPTKAATMHFLFTGVTGSGKTVNMLHLLKHVLTSPTSTCKRALIYDLKQEIVENVTRLGVHVESLTILNPYDSRSRPWDIAADVTDPLTAFEVASIIVPEEQSLNRYFTDAVRELLSAVMVSFHKLAPGRWTLRDVILAMRNPERLDKVLRAVPSMRDKLYHLETGVTFMNVLSTASTRLTPLEPIAALWVNSTQRPFSLSSWSSGQGIIVLGTSATNRAALDSVNRILFERLTQLVLSGPQQTEPQTWFFMDEVREARRLEGLSSLLTTGRSKGVSVVLGFQDIEGLQEEYKERIANELVGQCQNVVVMRLTSPTTAAWATKLFGQIEIERKRISESESWGDSGGSKSQTTSFENVTVDAVLASQFQRIPMPSPRGGFEGYASSAITGPFKINLPWQPTITAISTHQGQPGHSPRPASDQELPEWSHSDEQRLGLAGDGGSPVESVEPVEPVNPPDKPPPSKSGLSSITRDLLK